MKYIVYKTTVIKTGEYYFGYHCTEFLNDEYLGSGVLIQELILMYGREGLRRKVLFIFDFAKMARAKETELIRQNRSDPKCLNIGKGGEGGARFIQRNIPEKLDCSKITKTTVSVVREELIKPEVRRVAIHSRISHLVNKQPIPENSRRTK